MTRITSTLILGAVTLHGAFAASECSWGDFPVSFNGTECWGLTSVPSAASAADCMAACCTAGSNACQTWQWCEPGGVCSPANSCWIGAESNCRPVTGWVGGGRIVVPNLVVNATVPPLPATPLPAMGNATSPDGHTVAFDSVSMLMDGRRWLPVIGEMQYARMDPAKWRDDMLLAREGGLDTVGTYVFWIHHEEQQGVWNWSGANDLRAFVQTAAEVGLKVFLRIGPWAHGECRNGGFPDWLQQYPFIQLRSTQPLYLGFVNTLYQQIAAQIDGLMWYQGGPIIGAQLENEYGGNYTYLAALKQLAVQNGINLPFYSKTGWPSEPMPFGLLLPFFGQYADGFWSRVITPDDSYNGAFLFSPLQPGAGYPPLSVEIGGGMTMAYHRRIRMFPIDMGASTMVQLGSGTNCLGYYIYHGGHQPLGLLSTMEEAQDAAGYPNDLPVRSYDFYAPIGEWSQLHGHYHYMRRMHMIVRTWGSTLAATAAYMPETQPSGVRDNTTLRWSVRTDGNVGFLFVNNHQRQQDCSYVCTLAQHNNASFSVLLPSGNLTLPSAATGPVTIQQDEYFWWPFNLPLLSVATLSQATVSPLTVFNSGNASIGTLLVAYTSSSVPVEAVFASPGATITACTGTCKTTPGGVLAQTLPASLDVALAFNTAAGATLSMLLLNEPKSVRLWAFTAGQQEFLVLAGDANTSVVLNGSAPAGGVTLRVFSELPSAGSVMLFPAPSGVVVGGQPATMSWNGIFAEVSVPTLPPQVSVAWKLTVPAGPPRKVPIGPSGVAQAPNEDGGLTQWSAAAIYSLKLSTVQGGVNPSCSMRLQISYLGDCARVYLNGVLIADNFFNGDIFEVGLDRYAPEIYNPSSTVQLYIMPLSPDEPIYLYSWPDFNNGTSLVEIQDIVVAQRTDVPVVVTW